MPGKIQKIIFVYNADSGKRSAVMDSLHKVLSPSTYDCNLCSITFGLFTEKKVWKQFRNHAEVDMEFLHRDEFEKVYASKFALKYSYPVILAAVSGELEILVQTDELNRLNSAEELIQLLQNRWQSSGTPDV